MPALGRIPSPPDDRDWQLEQIQRASAFQAADPVAVLEAAAAAAEASTRVARETKNFIAAATPMLASLWQAAHPTPPQPPSTAIVWPDDEPVLDQGDYGTCVGNGTAQFLNANPVDDKFTEGMGQSATQGGPYARALYYEATVLDGSPDDPDAPGGGQQGATVRSGAKALKARGRIAAYAFASTLDAIRKHLDTVGPLIVGTDWTDDMFTPDAAGYVKPTGALAGGHCYLLIGDLPDDQAFEFLNSWGDAWGEDGRFKMKWSDFQTLLNANGEAVAAVELPLPS